MPSRGMFTGNRGCLVDHSGHVLRHHRGQLWIVCALTFKGWRHPIAEPNTWTPLFFLDEAVALAAGHRPCATCRRAAYESYRSAVSDAVGQHMSAHDLNQALRKERLRRGRGIDRRGDRILWHAPLEDLPPGTVVVISGVAHLVGPAGLQAFSFDGWGPSVSSGDQVVQVLTPPTSVAAMQHGFTPSLHPTAR